MRTNLNHKWIEQLVYEGKSYKDIVTITGYNQNSVYGYCLKKFGKLKDRSKNRRQTIPLSQDEKEFLFGTLLGDGNLQLSGKEGLSSMGRTNHSIKQEEYCRHKQNILNHIAYSVKYCTKTVNDKEYKQCYFCLKPNTELCYFYHLFYTNGKKDVPFDLTLLTPKALAWWFMDDGTAAGKCSISIATCNFSIEGLLRLKDYLKTTYDLDIVIQKDFKIYFPVDSGKKFYNIVKEYIIPSMMYKFKYLLI